MPDDSGIHRHRSGNATNRDVGEDVNPPPMTTEEFEALLRTATENDITTKTPSRMSVIFEILKMAAPTLAGLAVLAWLWLSKKFG